ncbi:MAG TPA: ROK family protein [Solirubrobacterales bacterium]|jgi:predicted NBD/HSP70 family sugar kinase
MAVKGQARAGKSARDRLVHALLQDAFDSYVGDGTDLRQPEPRGLTLAEVAQSAELSRPSVAVVREQLRPVLAEPAGPHGAQGTALDPSQGVAFGVEFRQTELTVCIADLHGRPLGEPWQEDKRIDDDPRLTLDRAAALINESLAAAGRRSDEVVGVGMSLAHPVDPRTTGAVRALSMSEDRGWRPWEGLGDVRQHLRQRLRWDESSAPSLKAFIADNDANLSAIAERHWGALRGRHNALYVFWGEGVGAGVIAGGGLQRGAGGIAGAIGHMPLLEGPDTLKCPRCGLSGCLETMVSAGAILARSGLAEEPGAIDRLVDEAAADTSSAAFQALDEAAFHLGRALGICLHVLNPEAIVLGGSIGFAAFELFRNGGLERGLRRQAASSARDDVNSGGIHRGRFYAHTAVRGAIARTLWEFLPEYLERRRNRLVHATSP